MDKIGRVKISLERLLKVWISKLDFDEEELVAKDLAWFNQVFGDFFKEENLNEFINKDGRYGRSAILPEIDFSEILESSIEFSRTKPERWERLKIEEPNLFDYYKQLDNSYLYFDGKYNLIDIYFRVFKKLYFFTEEKDLNRTKKLILSSIISITQKISIFEATDFNSNALLSDFYYVVLRNLLTEREIKEDKPDDEFISTSLFKSTFSVYYHSLFKPAKVQIAKRYLLNIWIYLNGLQKDNQLEIFLNSLSDMTLSNSSYREIDLYEIRAHLKDDDLDSDYYNILNRVKNEANQIISFQDLEDFCKTTILEGSHVMAPKYIPENITEYFLKTEEREAIQLYKFRSMQALILEYLSIVLHFKGNDDFVKSFNRLRKNEQWSNHRAFFPKSINDVLVWLIIYSELKRELNFRFLETSYGYKFLDVVIIFLFKNITYDIKSMENMMGLRGLLLDSSFLNSMTGVSRDLLDRIDGNDLLTDEERRQSSTFWNSMVNFFGGQIQKSESLTPIETRVFDDLISNISNQYLDKSLLNFLSNNLSQYNRNEMTQKELRTFVVASDLQLRKYVIPDWYSPAYGLSESIGRYLFEEENIQLDYNLFSKQIPLQDRELKRVDVQGMIDKNSKDSLAVFRNAYPDFWIIGKKAKADMTSPITFSFNTYDRNSELLIVPKSSISIQYVYDGRFKGVPFLEKKLMVELLDLGGGNEDNLLKVKSIKGFVERFNLKDEELRKHFWIRIAAKAKVVIKDKDSILRFKLNPYGE